MLASNHYYLGQITVSDHIENKQVVIKNVLLVSPDAISHDIQQAFVRNYIANCLVKPNEYPLDINLKIGDDNLLFYGKKGHNYADDLIPFVEYKISAIPAVEYLVHKQAGLHAIEHADLSMIKGFTAVKSSPQRVGVTAMLNDHYQIIKDGVLVDRIFSKHIIDGSVSSIVMNSAIQKVGLSDFAKVQSLIAQAAKIEYDPVVWGFTDMMEALHGESARSFATA